MDDVHKSFNIVLNLSATRTNAMWDILLTSEEETRAVAGNIRIKPVMMQTEYVGTRRTRIIFHRTLISIEEYHVRAFFTKYGQLEEVSSVKSKVALPLGR